MKLGIMFDAQDGMTWERWKFLTARVEDLGYESLWRSDHLFSIVGQLQRPALEAWVSLAYLATGTKRIRFGTLVSPMTFRHPSLLALTSAAVDVLSGGRLEVGLGAGWESAEHEAFGIPFPSVAKRMEMLDEGIGVMKSLWTEDRANFNGRIYSLRDASGHPKPHQRPHPPIVIGGIGEKRLLRIVAKYANEWNAYGISQEQYHAKRAILERHCQAMGRDPSEIRHSVAGPLVVAESEAELHHRITTLSRLFPLPALFPPSDAPDVAYRPETLRARGWFAGQPDQLVEQIQALSRDGIHRVILQQLDLDDEESLGLVARSVLPHVT